MKNVLKFCPIVVFMSLAACGGYHAGLPNAPAAFSAQRAVEQTVNARVQLAASTSVNLSTSNISKFSLISPSAEPDSVVVGSDGNLWIAENSIGHGKIAKVTTAGTVTEYAIPSGDDALALALGIGGAVWFTDSGRANGMIGRIDPTGHITEFHLPTGHCGGFGITEGPDGNMWFTDGCSKSIDRITALGTVSIFNIPTSFALPFGIVSGPNGDLWFSAYFFLGRVTTSGKISLIQLPTNEVHRPIVAGPDGNLYIASIHTNTIFKITPAGAVTSLADSFSAGAAAMAIGPDHNIWLVSEDGKLQRFNPVAATFSNVIDLPHPTGVTLFGGKGIVSGPDNDVWFTSGDFNTANYVGVYEL